jgi:hypothetical protein
MLANIEEIDESIYLSDEDCCPHTPEVIEHVYNQLSVEQLDAMSDGEDEPVAAKSQPSLPILNSSVLTAAQLEIGNAQRADPDLAPLIDYAHNQVIPFRKKAQRELFYSLARHYFLRDGVLYRSVLAPDGKEHCECIVVPFSIRRNLLTHFHEDVNGHLGFRKLFAKLHRRFFWERMHRDIRNFSRACLFCRSRKSVPDSKSGLPQRLPETTRFGSMMAYDIVGPFNKTKIGQYIRSYYDGYVFSLRRSRTYQCCFF